MCPGDTTEWEDIHRRLGNFAPKRKPIPQRELDKALVETLEQVDPLKLCNVDELEHLKDIALQDVQQDELERLEIRRRRAAQMKAARFGEVLQVTSTSFVHEVTEASGNGQWVLLLLYAENARCEYIERPWKEAAARFPALKFTRGLAREVMVGHIFPDAATPIVLLYHDENIKATLEGLEPWGGKRCDRDCIEWTLSEFGVVPTELEEDPRKRPAQWKRGERRLQNDAPHQEDDDKDGGYDRCYTSNKLGSNFMLRH